MFRSFRKLLGYYGDAKLILVDIPIGLPESKGGRDCDRAARRSKLGTASRLECLPDADSSDSPAGIAST